MNSRLTALSARVTRAAQQFPDHYAGVVIGDSELIVHAVKPHTELREAVLSVANPHHLPITFVAADNTFAKLTRVTRELAARSSAYELVGVDLVSWGPNVRTNRVEVAVSSEPAQAAALINADFPATIVWVNPESRPHPRRARRT